MKTIEMNVPEEVIDKRKRKYIECEKEGEIYE